MKIHLIIARIHLVFSTSLSFCLIFLLFSGVLHGGSTWWFIKDLNFLLQVFIEIIFKGALAFSILLSEVLFFLPYLWRWFYIILDNLSSCFMIHTLLRMRYFKSINLFVGMVLGYISPKAFLRIIAIHGAYKGPKIFFILPVKYFLISLVIPIQFFLPWVAGCHLIIWDVFHKTISEGNMP